MTFKIVLEFLMRETCCASRTTFKKCTWHIISEMKCEGIKFSKWIVLSSQVQL